MMSRVYRQDLNWLINDFTARVPYVAHSAVVSADGVPLALSDGIPDYFAEHLAAITSGLASLMAGAARIFEAGQGPAQVSSCAIAASDEADDGLQAAASIAAAGTTSVRHERARMATGMLLQRGCRCL